MRKFINCYNNIKATEKELGKEFYINPMRAKNKETEGWSFYVNSKKYEIRKYAKYIIFSWCLYKRLTSS